MAFSNFAYTNPSSGVCSGMRNSGTNGDLAALLDTALTSGSNWTKVYDTTNQKIWQPAAGGPVLMVNHDSASSGNAGLAVVRLAESQSGGTLTDECPKTTQVGDVNCNWLVSSAANTTTRDFHIVAWETGVIYASKYSGTTNLWEIGFAMQCISRFAGDTTYNWAIGTRAVSAEYFASLITVNTNPQPSATGVKVFALRDVTASLKSEYLTVNGRDTSLGVVSSAPAIRAGVGNSVDRERVCFHGNSSTTASLGSATVVMRLCAPQLWAPVHSSLAGVSEADTILDGSSQFVLLKNSGNGVLLRITNDEVATFPSS